MALSFLMVSIFPSAAQQPVITQMTPETVSKVDALEGNIATLAADLPVDLPSIGAISSFVYNRPANQVVMTLKITNPDLVSVLKISVEGMRQSFSNFFGEAFREITEDVYDVGGSIALRFTDANNSMLNEFVYTNADLYNILHAEQVSDKEKMRQLLIIQTKELKSYLPIDQGDGVVFSDAEYDNGKGVITYWYEVDESAFDMDLLSAETLLLAAKYDLTTSKFLSCLKKGEVTIIYKYKGKNTGREVEFQITPDQIKSR